MTVVELVIDRLLEIEDVIPFRFVSHHSKYHPERRICNIILQNNTLSVQDEDELDGVGVLVVETNWTMERTFLTDSDTFDFQANEVRDSEAGWTIRFRGSYKARMPVVAEVPHVSISLRTPTSFDRESRLNVYNENHDSMFNHWYLDIRELHHIGCGKFSRTFPSGVSVCYEVDQGPVNDILTKVSTLEKVSETESDESEDEEVTEALFNNTWNGYSWLRNHVSERGEDKLFVYEILYVDVYS
jgi:hypothetical protein